MSDETPAETSKAKSVKRPKVVKPRPGSKVVPARTKADKARLAQKQNFAQIALPKSLATMTDEEIMQWAAQLHAKMVAKMKKNVPDENVEP